MPSPRPPGSTDLSGADRRSVESTQQSYERIPYQTNPWTSSQPARLETVAKLRGLEAAPANGCRVLELGCGTGGNLIPLAIAHPRSDLVGLDLAPGHIDTACAVSSELELGNVAFVADSFVDWGDDDAPFDYIVAHGLMSWVTPELQGRLFETVARLLAPRGVAFISYNTYPGWYMQHSIRQLLRSHNRGVDDVEEAVERSRALLDVLVRTVPERESAYRDYLESVGAVARNPARRYYFAHEYLEDENHPFYVRDFIERARGTGLLYLGDADLIDSELDNMPDEPSKLLEELAGDAVGRLQMLDYAVNRKFRQSLLCRDDVALREIPDLGRVSEMYVASALVPEEDAGAVDTPLSMQFSDRHGRTIELDQPVAKAALVYFVEVSRQPIAFDELIEWAWQRAGGRPAPGSPEEAEQRQLLAVVFGRLLLADMVEVSASAPAWAVTLPRRPEASPLARRAARLGENATSLRHRSISLDNAAVRSVLQVLDGSRDRAEVRRAVAGEVEAEDVDKILDLAVTNALILP